MSGKRKLSFEEVRLVYGGMTAVTIGDASQSHGFVLASGEGGGSSGGGSGGEGGGGSGGSGGEG